MDLDAFEAVLRAHCTASLCLDTRGGRQALALADCLKRYTRKRAEDAVRACPTAPTVQIHMSDGWGAFCNTTSTARALSGSHLVTTRTGKFRHEFLLQRVLLRQRLAASGSDRLLLLVGDPEGLSKGKGSWNVLVGSCRFTKTLREMGHRGLCANVYIMDGAMYSALARKFAARHRLQAGLLDVEEHERAVLEIQEFTLSIKCVSHGCNNGTKWGLKAAGVADACDDAHICTKSCRNSSTAFHSHIDLFLIQYLEYVPERSGFYSDVLAFWQALGMHPEIADELARSDLHWDGQRLRVLASFQLEPCAFGRIAGMVLHLMRWCDFSETRWCGSGPAGRLFLAALAGGMDGIHEVCRSDPHCSREKMAGISRATPQVRYFLAIAALSAYSTESVGLELLEDDRFLRRSHELWGVMQDELMYLHDLPPLVWEKTAALISVETRPEQLRDSCLFAAHAGSAYLWDDSFLQLSRPPLNVTQGDVSANVASIHADTWDPLGRDPLAAQVKACLNIGVPAAQLVRLFETIRDGATTINIVEQGHASHAVILKQHEKVQERLLRARSTIHQCRAMLVPSRKRSRVEQLEVALEHLDRRQVQRCSFRAFSKLLADAEVAACLGEEPHGSWAPSASLAARRRLFALVPRPLLRAIEELSLAQTIARRRRLAEERVRLMDELSLSRVAAAANKEAFGLRNIVVDCQFNQGDMQGLLDMYNAFGVNDMHRVEHESLEPLEVPDANLRAVIEAHQVTDDVADPLPWWARHIAVYRDYFRSTAVSSQRDFAIAWLILVCKQAPWQVICLELRRVDRTIDMQAGIDDFCDGRKIFFEVFPVKYVNASDILVGLDAELFILPDTFFEGRCVCAVCAPLSFDEFSRRLPADLARGRGREPGGRRERVPKEAPGFREAMRAEAPWLSDADFAMAMGTKRPRGESASGHAGRGRAPSESSSATEGPPSDRGGETRADDIGPDIAIFDPSDLIAMRAAEDVAEHKEMDFYVRILGGAWTLAHTGEIADGCSYFARAGTAQLWCRVFAFPRQRGFHYRKYGREGPHILCNEIARRAQFFYDLWLGSDDADFSYTAELRASYEEGAEFQAWFAGLEPDSLLHRTALQVLQLFPAMADA